MRRMESRFVLLFSRAPCREAREKGLEGPAGELLFADFATGWMSAARRAGARVVLASEPADRPVWRRLFFGSNLLLIEQRGGSFGERLENAARDAAGYGGTFVVVGGDVAPSAAILSEAFELLEEGADCVLAPSVDGGVSLLSLRAEDFGLLREIAPRRRDVFARLRDRLSGRGRRIAVVSSAADVDSRRQLRFLFRSLPGGLIRGTVRRALSSGPVRFEPIRRSLQVRKGTISTRFRAPPAAA